MIPKERRAFVNKLSLAKWLWRVLVACNALIAILALALLIWTLIAGRAGDVEGPLFQLANLLPLSLAMVASTILARLIYDLDRPAASTLLILGAILGVFLGIFINPLFTLYSVVAFFSYRYVLRKISASQNASSLASSQRG